MFVHFAALVTVIKRHYASTDEHNKHAYQSGSLVGKIHHFVTSILGKWESILQVLLLTNVNNNLDDACSLHKAKTTLQVSSCDVALVSQPKPVNVVLRVSFNVMLVIPVVVHNHSET